MTYIDEIRVSERKLKYLALDCPSRFGRKTNFTVSVWSGHARAKEIQCRNSYRDLEWVPKMITNQLKRNNQNSGINLDVKSSPQYNKINPNFCYKISRKNIYSLVMNGFGVYNFQLTFYPLKCFWIFPKIFFTWSDCIFVYHYMNLRY